MPDANNDNVTSIETKRPAPTCRFTIQATLRGFPITIEGEGRAADLKTIVDRLVDAGAEPPTAPTSTPAQAESAKKAAPKCPDHGTPMKPSRKPGSFFCPRRADDGDFCPHKT